VALPRFSDGDYVDVSGRLNAIAEEIDHLGVCCVVARTSHGTLPNVTDVTFQWQVALMDTYGGMWDESDPYAVTIRVPGVYSLILQERFGHPHQNPPYSVGQRAGKLMLNGTSVFTHSIASDKKGASIEGEGVTLAMSTTVPLNVGDRLYCNIWQSSGATIDCIQTDYGGTYLAAARVGPLV
jgi:hypothetical protein